MKIVVMNTVLWILSLPVTSIAGLARVVRRIPFWKVAYSATIPCRTCKAPISLVGMWKCACGWTYRGHALRHCPLCYTLPRVARCLACGCTVLLPEDR